MYDIAKSVIMSKRFELSDMLKKIDTLWVQGSLTDDQKTELVDLARQNADPAMSADILARLEDIETRLRKLETGSDGGELPSPEYPEYVSGRVYRKGDKVTYKGQKYICVLNEYTDSTTWSPEAYPVYWQEVKEGTV